MAPKDRTTLGKFDKKEIVAVEVKIMKTGDGLSEPMRLNPVKFDHGEEVTFVGRGRVVDVQHPEVKDDPSKLRRVHRVDCSQVVLLLDEQSGLVDRVLQENAEWLRKALNDEAGITELFDDADPEDGTPGDDEGGPDDPLREVIG